VSIALANFPDLPAPELVAGAGFLAGFWLGEAVFVEVVKRRRLPSAAVALPRSNPWANFLLLFPGYVLANVLLARGPAYFIAMLLLLVLALALIALYLTATAREAVLIERAEALAAASRRADVS